MIVETAQPSPSSQWLELLWQVGYYRSQHARAVDRENIEKQKNKSLEEIVCRQAVQITELSQQVEALKAKCVWLKQQLFGKKSEQKKPPADASVENKRDGCDSQHDDEDESKPKKRGQARGSNGHGRTCHPELPTEIIPCNLPDEKQHCEKCGKPFIVFPGTEDSEEIHWEVRIIRRLYKRTRYQSACNCKDVPGIVAAPLPPKLIPKGKFSIGFWVRLLMEKFLFQRPLYRLRMVLALEGLEVSQGTLTGGLQHIAVLLQPVYERIIEHSHTAQHRQMDETRWFVWADMEGKTNHRWWLWVDVTLDTCVYILDPFRSAEVLKKHLGSWEGFISADRYSVYKAHQVMIFNLGGKICLAFCWSHVRRDFLDIFDGYPRLRAWAKTWWRRIQELFMLNAERLKQRSNIEIFRANDQKVREAVSAMKEACDQEAADPTLHIEQKKTMVSMRNHWDGLTLFVDHPEIPMDNNESERRLRNPIIGRKNYYGSGSIWSGHFSATAFSIFQTLLKNHIDPQQWLEAYFEACAQNRGKAPDNINAFLPWNLSADQKAAWRYPKHPP